MRKLTPKDLDLVNLVLVHDPALAQAFFRRAEDLAKGLAGLGQEPATTPAPAQEGTPPAVPLEDRIHVWFKDHAAGKHTLATVRKDLGITDGSKPFKTAMGKLQGDGRVKANDKRGRGALYWFGK